MIEEKGDDMDTVTVGSPMLGMALEVTVGGVIAGRAVMRVVWTWQSAEQKVDTQNTSIREVVQVILGY